MSRFFDMKRCDPRDTGYKVFKHRSFTINPGITVLTGCNGAGKSTLIWVMKQSLDKNKILYTSYDNYHDGGNRAKDMALHDGAMNILAGLSFSSEGESININLAGILDRAFRYSQTKVPEDLLSRDERLHRIFHRYDFETDEVWIFLDACDSGMSINAVVDLKAVIHRLHQLLVDAGREPYIIVAANEYEMCDGEQCFEAQSLKYTTYKTYKSYKNSILKSARYKYAERDKAALREEKQKRQKQERRKSPLQPTNRPPLLHLKRDDFSE